MRISMTYRFNRTRHIRTLEIIKTRIEKHKEPSWSSRKNTSPPPPIIFGRQLKIILQPNCITRVDILPGNMWGQQKYKLIPIKQWRKLAITLHIAYIALYPKQWRKCNTIRRKWQKMEGTHQRNNEKRSLYT